VRGSDIPANRLGTAKPMVIVTGWKFDTDVKCRRTLPSFRGSAAAFLYLSVSSGASYKLLKP